jgi:type IV pilus assembly protein PilP
MTKIMNTSSRTPGLTPRKRPLAGVLLTTALVLGLGGCVDRDMSDLERYVEEVLARPSPVVAPLPQIKPYEIYAYQSSDKKDPFQPFFTPDSAPPKQEEQTECPGPDKDRLREELEAFPLDSLRMVGTIERDGTLWGVVLSSEGSIYRVTMDNFMGRNDGRIVDIVEEQIELIEIVPDGQGCYQERTTRLALIEQ